MSRNSDTAKDRKSNFIGLKNMFIIDQTFDFHGVLITKLGVYIANVSSLVEVTSSVHVRSC